MSDADNDAITAYQFWDSTAICERALGGQRRGAGRRRQTIDVTAAQLASTTFQTDRDQMTCGYGPMTAPVWGAWTEFHVNAPANQRSGRDAGSTSASHGQVLYGNQPVRCVDTDERHDHGLPVLGFDARILRAGTGWSDGVAQGAGQTIDVTAAQFASATFQSGSGSDDLWVRANDGTMWGAMERISRHRARRQRPGRDGSGVAGRNPWPEHRCHQPVQRDATRITTRSRPTSSGIRRRPVERALGGRRRGAGRGPPST